MLPAYEAGESLAGFTRMVQLSLYYAAHGIVRHRNPKSRLFDVLVYPPEHGSFEWILEVITDPSRFGAIANGLITNGIYDFIKYITQRVTGQPSDIRDQTALKLIDTKAADIEAVLDAIEPSAKRFHTPIGNGATNALVINGDGNTINFNAGTKEYVNTSVKNIDPRGKVFRISALNVNSGHGRAFDNEERRSFPFQIIDKAAPDTRKVVAGSLNRYANETDPWIRLEYTSVDGPNGRVKKLLVHGATAVAR